MLVLVTGGSGRLGRSVLAELGAQGHEVVSVDTAPAGGDGVRAFPADLSEPGECYSTLAQFRPDAVVHLAAVPAPNVRSEIATFGTNATMAFNVCQAAFDLGVGRTLVASSPTVAGYGNPGGWLPSYLPLDEDHPVAPWNAYTLSKVATESVVRGFASRGRGRFHSFRPCFVVSPEEWRGAPSQGGGTIRDRLGTPERAASSLFNYVDARDAARFVRLLVEGADEVPGGETFFVCADDALATEPLAELLPRYTPVTEELAASLTGTAPAFDTGKAARLLGWKPCHRWRDELTETS
ncbi:NAD-dependent epimerase/dehydratase family protein [Saccharomonospora saliphila]|uniref:NAD-dependent epimerase/dehydratase family protein n=1 Tax=Saccharomonospora saliphila TaxID=369829 RepID=UPI00036F4C17|nr:NAD(P)-dependent oxidoreductase [Saccharomonospora saliphila]